MKKFKISVHKAGEAGADDEHVVKVSISKKNQEIGKFCLAGGTLEHATGIALGLKDLVDSGFDLTTFMPDDVAVVEAL